MKVRQMKHRARSILVWRNRRRVVVHHARKHCAWPPAYVDLRTAAYVTASEQQHAQEQRARDHEAEVYEQAYIAACELVGPNDIEFDSVLERLMDEML